jgi:hypothetical protein
VAEPVVHQRRVAPGQAKLVGHVAHQGRGEHRSAGHGQKAHQGGKKRQPQARIHKKARGRLHQPFGLSAFLQHLGQKQDERQDEDEVGGFALQGGHGRHPRPLGHGHVEAEGQHQPAGQHGKPQGLAQAQARQHDAEGEEHLGQGQQLNKRVDHRRSPFGRPA